MLAKLERSGTQAGPFDGMTEVNNWHWQDLVSRGCSPTALGTYAQCPMRYWMTHVLKSQREQDTILKELSSRVWGELVHDVLCEVYQVFSTQGWPQQAMDSAQFGAIVHSTMDQVFQDYAQRFGKGYPLIWEWMRSRLIRMMVSLLERDQVDFLEHGWMPSEYEVDAVGALPRDDQTESELLHIRGRFDRVDQARDHSGVRIVDYKVSMRRSCRDEELDLVSKALQGRQLQPPLYSFMTPMNAQRETREEAGCYRSHPVSGFFLLAAHTR